MENVHHLSIVRFHLKIGMSSLLHCHCTTVYLSDDASIANHLAYNVCHLPGAISSVGVGRAAQLCYL